jgi:putative inorganic carbon (HCO3(-)) transporter
MKKILNKILKRALFTDILVITLAYCLAYRLRYNPPEYFLYQMVFPFKGGYIPMFSIWGLLIITFLTIIGLYIKDKRITLSKELLTIISGIFCSAIFIGALIFILKYKFFSRQIFLESILFLFLGLIGLRLIKAVVDKPMQEPITGAGLNKFLVGIDSLTRFFLYLLIAVLPFSKAGVEICFIIAFSLWIIRHTLCLNIKPENTILSKSLGFYIIAGIMSVIGSVYFKGSLSAFFTKFLEGILLYFVITEVIKRKRDIYIIIALLFCSALVVSLDGIIQKFFTGSDLFRQMLMTRGGITAAFNHKNDLGGYMLFPILTVFSLAFYKLRGITHDKQKRFNKYSFLGYSLLFLLFNFIILLTNSLGAWVALILGILVLSFLMGKRAFMPIIISLCFLTVVSVLYSNFIPQEFSLDSQKLISAQEGRFINWKPAISMIKDKPFFGFGLNTYMMASQIYLQSMLTYAHNCYLQMAAETGIIGLFAFLLVVGRLFLSGIRLLFVPGSSDGRNTAMWFLLAGLLAGLFAFLAHSFVDTNLYSLQLNALFWYMMGLTVCVYNILKRGNEHGQIS